MDCYLISHELQNQNFLISRPIFILVTRRVKGYTRFPIKYILNRITRRVDIAMSVYPPVCLSVWRSKSETRKPRKLGFGMLIFKLLVQQAGFYAHSYAHKRE